MTQRGVGRGRPSALLGPDARAGPGDPHRRVRPLAARRHGAALASRRHRLPEIQAWASGHPAEFWGAVAEFFDVALPPTGPDAVCDGSTMPGHGLVPRGASSTSPSTSLRAAATRAGRRHDGRRGRDRPRLTHGELRRPGRARRRPAARARRTDRRPGRRLPAELDRGRRRLPGHRLDRSHLGQAGLDLGAPGRPPTGCRSSTRRCWSAAAATTSRGSSTTAATRSASSVGLLPTLTHTIAVGDGRAGAAIRTRRRASAVEPGVPREAPPRTRFRCRSTTHCGCCSPRAPPASPRASCTATAARCWSSSPPRASTSTCAMTTSSSGSRARTG